MTNYLQGKTALITGASSGIGREVAYDLARWGVDLILVARDQAALETMQKEITRDSDIRVTLCPLDVRDREAVGEALGRLLSDVTVDILINSAGLALGLEPLDQGQIDDWEGMIDTNIKGLLYVTRAIAPQMRDLPTAHIVNLGSVAGKSAYPGGGVYCATKAAVHSLGESMNADFYGTNIKVTTIAPGAVETRFSNVRFHGDDARADAVYEGYEPLRADDISDAIVSVLNTPPHVNIQYLDIMPTAQRNPYLLYRESSQ